MFTSNNCWQILHQQLLLYIYIYIYIYVCIYIYIFFFFFFQQHSNDYNQMRTGGLGDNNQGGSENKNGRT